MHHTASETMKPNFAICFTFVLAMFLSACSTMPPEGLRPVSDFDLNRYLGQWYEIARLDHAFERGLRDVNATYHPDSTPRPEI